MPVVSSPSQSFRIITAEPKKRIKWRMMEQFPDKESALDFIRGQWRKLVTNDSAGQRSDSYHRAEHGKPCSARAKLVYRKDEENVMYYYEAQAAYNYVKSDNVLPSDVKKTIEEILRDGPKSLIPLSSNSTTIHALLITWSLIKARGKSGLKK